MKKLHKELSAARSDLEQLDGQIQAAKETADRLPEFQAQRTEIVGDAYLSGKVPDVAGIDALILSAEGASAAISVLTGQRPEKVEQIQKAERHLDTAIEGHVMDRFNASILVYKDALDNLRGAMIEMTAVARAMPGTRGHQLQMAVSYVHEPISKLLHQDPLRGWNVYGMISPFGIGDEVQSRTTEINSELLGY